MTSTCCRRSCDSSRAAIVPSGYEEIGSRNAAGDVIGGDRLAEGTVELERYWRRGFGAALFVDAGDSFLGDDFRLHVGAGVGVRWKSPVGVLRFDLSAHRFELARRRA